MSARLIDGLALARTLRGEIAARAAALAMAGQPPGLAVVLVGDDPASHVYVRNKVRACAEAGIRSTLEQYDASLGEAELLRRIGALNADARSRSTRRSGCSGQTAGLRSRCRARCRPTREAEPPGLRG